MFIWSFNSKVRTYARVDGGAKVRLFNDSTKKKGKNF